MKKRELGKSGLFVSPIGLGCMGFSHAYGKPTDRNEAIEMIREAVKIGYTFFDTAEIYGSEENPHENEEIVGEALKPYRDQVVISTKFGIRFDTESEQYPSPLIPDAREEVIRKSVDESLQRLQVDTIDLYFQHRIDPHVEPEKVAKVMKELIAEGKIAHWGVSEADEEYIRRAHAVCPITAIQNRYSMMARHYEKLFPVLEELGIGFVAFSPIANGFLSGKYGKDSHFDKRLDYRSVMPQFTNDAIDENQQLLDLLRTIAEQKNATCAQISLAWMLSKKPYLSAMPGTRKIERLKENFEACEIELSQEEIKRIDQKLNEIPMSAVFGVSSKKVEE